MGVLFASPASALRVAPDDSFGELMTSDRTRADSPSIYHKIKKHAVQGTLSTAITRTFRNRLKRKRQPVPYQAEKQNAAEKWAVVEAGLRNAGARSLLDVGCASGEITRLAGSAGYFAAGIDKNLDLRGVEDPLRGVCLGEVPITDDMLDRLPAFDAILLLSVHHQWVKLFGDEQAREMVRQLGHKARHCLIVEFAAINSKYGTIDSPLFTDNDEDSVTRYASQWLQSTFREWTISFLGRCSDRPQEPFRYIFSCQSPE
jgi:SAM-dependent methyltransferase